MSNLTGEAYRAYQGANEALVEISNIPPPAPPRRNGRPKPEKALPPQLASSDSEVESSTPAGSNGSSSSGRGSSGLAEEGSAPEGSAPEGSAAEGSGRSGRGAQAGSSPERESITSSTAVASPSWGERALSYTSNKFQR